MCYSIDRAALSRMDGPAFNGSDIIDRHAQPKVRDNLRYIHQKQTDTYI